MLPYRDLLAAKLAFLLKLRQICCAPRLVKLDAARSVLAAAKLARLPAILDDLVAASRQIRVVSPVRRRA